MRRSITAGAAVALAGLLATVVLAGTVVGTPKNDVLRGTASADTIDGKAGNDKLYGLAGNDLLIGGGGNDLLVGGPGADVLNCGPGNDTAKADDSDQVSPTCERVTGLTPPPHVSIADATIVEGQAGTASLSFPVTLSAASKKPVSVRFATADGTATASADYVSASGTITFSPGEKSNTIGVAVVSDPVAEPDETFSVTLSNPVNATIGDGSATGTITNDDVRGGRYAGTTSQGKALSFDVAPDVTALSGLTTLIDMSCNLPIDMTNLTFPVEGLPIRPDWSFGGSDSVTTSNGSTFDISLDGRLSMPGNASGTLRVGLSLVVPVFGRISCSTGDVTWTAQASS